jgi:hypothetical protein
MLERSLFADPVASRRIALVRFLLGEGAAFDALAVLDAGASADDPAAGARLAALRGVASLLAGRVETAADLLPDAGPEASRERWLWRAMLAAERGDAETAGDAFARSGQVWRGYPLPLRRLVARRAADVALTLDAPQVALAVLHQVADEAPAGALTGALALLEARAMHASGDVAAARAALDRLERSAEGHVRRRARLARVRLDHAEGRLDDAAALAALAPDAVAWTGRDGAERFWTFLGELRAATGDAPGAVAAWSRADADLGADAPLAVLDALIAGEPPFADALGDAVDVVRAHVDALPEGAARARRLQRLAARVAAETDALHVADELYRRALDEPVPHATAVELRTALARLRLDRQLPEAALEALAPLADGRDADVDALRAEARLRREGRVPRTEVDPPGTAVGGEDVDDVLEAVERTLAETRDLLERDADADDGS